MTREEIERMAFDGIPPSYCERLVRAVFAAHSAASKLCDVEFADTERKNTIGFVRRAKLEGYMRDAADREPGVTYKVISPPGNPWNHTEIYGGSVVLTASAVPTPGAMVEHADFRDTLAQKNDLTLFPLEDEDTADVPLYALLLHSRSVWLDADDHRQYRHLPGSAYLAFPTPKLDYYTHTINLFDRFSETVESCLPQAWSEEARVRFLHRSQRVVGL